MSNGNENAGRQPAPEGPARRPSITSPAALAAHLGRELSAAAVDGNGWTDLHYAAALDWAALARALLAAGGAAGRAAADRRRGPRPSAAEHAEQVRPGPAPPDPPCRRDPAPHRGGR